MVSVCVAATRPARDSAGGGAGLATGGVPEAVTLGSPIGATDTPGTIASYAVGRRIVTLLDVEALLAPGRVGGGVL